MVIVLRRWHLIGMTALIAVLASAGAASATCIVQPIAEVVRDADAVWWAHVTAAEVATPYQMEGTWDLTVQIDDVLKGPGSPGEAATVVSSGCGPPSSFAQQRESAHLFVGQQRLFIGQIDKRGRLVAFNQMLSPAGLSQTELYQHVAVLLGHGPAVPVAEEPPATPIGWLLPSLVLVALAVTAFAVQRRRATHR